MSEGPILICYDGSEGARRAIATAAGLLGPRQAVVLDVGPALTVAESIALTSSVVPGNAFEELNEADALVRARDGARLANEAGFRARARATLGTPTWEGIADVADELDAPLIVVGSRALSRLREFFEGSVSEDVVHHAGRPVLIVPPPHDER
ncbi:MAG TPA: universal stress protein [Gaiellaceae bacterium]|jgi:nucleotide-binding universal stress UspA family protein|nr:universal stress protein [Gaiellaceae bacterium]